MTFHGQWFYLILKKKIKVFCWHCIESDNNVNQMWFRRSQDKALGKKNFKWKSQEWSGCLSSEGVRQVVVKNQALLRLGLTKNCRYPYLQMSLRTFYRTFAIPVIFFDSIIFWDDPSNTFLSWWIANCFLMQGGSLRRRWHHSRLNECYKTFIENWNCNSFHEVI